MSGIFSMLDSQGPTLGSVVERLRRSIRESVAGQRLTKLLNAPHTRGERIAVCASGILLTPMFLEALTLRRVIVLPTELPARSTALVLGVGP